MGEWRAIQHDDNPQNIIDKHFTLTCPHCNSKSNVTAISIPRFNQLNRYHPRKIIIGYRCDGCNEPIALRFRVVTDYPTSDVRLADEYEELEHHVETFAFQYLPAEVASDFREALVCYSQRCFNATAAMCRRTVQSMAENLGAVGSSKVQKQILEAKEAADLDDETFAGISQAVLDGHDGAHPHLPTVTPQRAAVLVSVMKDVLEQIYVRKAKIQEAAQLRQDAISARRPT